MIGKRNQMVFLTQIDTSNYTVFVISEFELSKFNCMMFYAIHTLQRVNLLSAQVHVHREGSVTISRSCSIEAVVINGRNKLVFFCRTFSKDKV